MRQQLHLKIRLKQFKQLAEGHGDHRVLVFPELGALRVSALDAQAQALLTYTGFAIILFSGVTVVALFVLRVRQPDAERPFRAWGYPIAPALYVVASVLILANGLYTAPGPTGAGALVILGGLPIYLLFRRGARAAGADPHDT